MQKNIKFRCYDELIQLKTFDERLQYLMLNGYVGDDTFGSKRYLNQVLYTRDKEWLKTRDKVIIRDCGRDLGIPGFEMDKYIQVHHIIPLTTDDILERNPKIYDMNNLICCSDRTHKLIHYSKTNDVCELLLFNERRKDDTCPWKQTT